MIHRSQPGRGVPVHAGRYPDPMPLTNRLDVANALPDWMKLLLA